ncbi:hypothetical protein [Cupriavidus sp. AcVe19-6a]|uniref:hypothetical protein n=1 Tax=Cupriavidus sp. AcVe19-6a TaxID=2821358 RepID=UPI001AE945C2|nr:hypothetical protein [Cupriavidus sp. AcVe19-6a]MBP0634249.1 hypothetical protein [Cupriavidus sp. AcVe19-6a]
MAATQAVPLAPRARFVDCLALAASAVVAWRCGASVRSIALAELHVDVVLPGDMSPPERAACLLARSMSDRYLSRRPANETAEVWLDDLENLARLGTSVRRAGLVCRVILAEHRHAVDRLAERIGRDGLLFVDELADFASLYGLAGRGPHPLFALRA